MKSKIKGEFKLFLYVLMGMILSWALYVGYAISLNQKCLQQEGLSSTVFKISQSYIFDLTNMVTFGVLKVYQNELDDKVNLINKEFGISKDTDKCAYN